MNADPTSARGMLDRWFSGGHFLQLVVAGSQDGVVSPFSTVVQLTSVGALKVEAVVSGTVISIGFPALDMIPMSLGSPTEKYPAFEQADFKNRVRGPWVIFMYPKYVVAFAEIP